MEGGATAFFNPPPPIHAYATSLYRTDYVTKRDNLNSFQVLTLEYFQVNISIEYENLNQMGQKNIKGSFYTIETVAI